jgi:hypothetical protein
MDPLQRKSSSNTNSSLSSTSVSPIIQQKSHSRSSSSSSTSNSSLQKKAKLNDEMNNNQSLSDLSQFVQLNKDERSFLPPQPPNQSNEKEGITVTTKTDLPTTTNENSKGVNPNIDQRSSTEEKSLASRCTVSSSNTTKQRHSTETSLTNVPITSLNKSLPVKIK